MTLRTVQSLPDRPWTGAAQRASTAPFRFPMAGAGDPLSTGGVAVHPCESPRTSIGESTAPRDCGRHRPSGAHCRVQQEVGQGRRSRVPSGPTMAMRGTPATSPDHQFHRPQPAEFRPPMPVHERGTQAVADQLGDRGKPGRRLVARVGSAPTARNASSTRRRNPNPGGTPRDLLLRDRRYAPSSPRQWVIATADEHHRFLEQQPHVQLRREAVGHRHQRQIQRAFDECRQQADAPDWLSRKRRRT